MNTDELHVDLEDTPSLGITVLPHTLFIGSSTQLSGRGRGLCFEEYVRLQQSKICSSKASFYLADPSKAGTPLTYVSPALCTQTGLYPKKIIGRSHRCMFSAYAKHAVIRAVDATVNQMRINSTESDLPGGFILLAFKRHGMSKKTPYLCLLHLLPIYDKTDRLYRVCGA